MSNEGMTNISIYHTECDSGFSPVQFVEIGEVFSLPAKYTCEGIKRVPKEITLAKLADIRRVISVRVQRDYESTGQGILLRYFGRAKAFKFAYQSRESLVCIAKVLSLELDELDVMTFKLEVLGPISTENGDGPDGINPLIAQETMGVINKIKHGVDAEQGVVCH